MTTTYLGQSVQDLTKIGRIDFTEHYPQYLPKKGVWELWTYSPGSTPRPASPVYIWLDRDALILVDNEQWANDLCTAGYKVGLTTPNSMVLLEPVQDDADFVPPTLTDVNVPGKRYAVLVGNLFVGIADLCDAQYIAGTTKKGWVLPLPPSNDVLDTYNRYRYKGMPMTVTNDGGYKLSPEMEAGMDDLEWRSRFDVYAPCRRYTLTLGDVCEDVDLREFYYKGYPILGWELNSQLSGVNLETVEGKFEVEFPTHLSKIDPQRHSYTRRRTMVTTAC